MKVKQVMGFRPVNTVDNERVRELVVSMKANGFVGCPILVWNNELITGSHRLAAINALLEEYNVTDDYGKAAEVEEWEVAEDVTEICEENYARFVEENGYEPEIDYSSIGWLLEGSWVEEYKDQIAEW